LHGHPGDRGGGGGACGHPGGHGSHGGAGGLGLGLGSHGGRDSSASAIRDARFRIPARAHKANFRRHFQIARTNTGLLGGEKTDTSK